MKDLLKESVHAELRKIEETSCQMYNGGYHEEEKQKIFHHGIRTGLSVAESFIDSVIERAYASGYMNGAQNGFSKEDPRPRLTKRQIEILDTIRNKPDVTYKNLCEKYNVALGTMQTHIQALISKGFLIKNFKAHKDFRVINSLTTHE